MDKAEYRVEFTRSIGGLERALVKRDFVHVEAHGDDDARTQVQQWAASCSFVDFTITRIRAM